MWWRFPRFPTPRLYLGPWAWFFVMMALAAVYVCMVIVWGMLALMYWFYAGIVKGVRWAYTQIRS